MAHHTHPPRVPIRPGDPDGPVDFPDGQLLFETDGRLPSNFLQPAQRRGFWAPWSLPSGPTVFLASSRLGQRPETKPRWFDALRTFVSQSSFNLSSQPVLLSHASVASYRFVKRAAALWRIPLVDFAPFQTG